MILPSIQSKANAGQKQLAVLIDPDRLSGSALEKTISLATTYQADLLLVGSSLLTQGNMNDTIEVIRKHSPLPVVIFPGNTLQVSGKADALLFLSLISGRNAEMLIGKHVVAAPYIRESGLEVIPTGYMLIDSGKPTAALYMSHSQPIPADQFDIALCTAQAGEMLGLKMIYMDAGSGAAHPIDPEMIARVRAGIQIPLIIGGGIRKADQAITAWKAGADLIVVGNAIERDPSFITELTQAREKLL